MTSDDFFTRIETQYQNKLPFVAYRKPNRKTVDALLQRDIDLHFTKNFTEKGFVFSPFDDSERTVLIPFGNSEKINCFVLSEISEVLISQSDNVSQPEFHKNHINLIYKGVEAIKKNQFKKVVLSRTETVTVSENNPITIFKSLLSAYSSAFVYCWYHPKVGLWLGATPETLVKIEGNRFSIMALAGTQDYKGSIDVVWGNKELKEQKYVTDFILNELKTSLENIKVSETETVKAGNLLHLKTQISGTLNVIDLKLKALLYSLHPTPAVCGSPKQEAKQFILKHENYNREFYTGFLGELNLNTISAPRSGKRNIENRAYAINRTSTQLYVNLRCMKLKDNKATIYVGGGITENSNAESEWKETVSKSLVIKTILKTC